MYIKGDLSTYAMGHRYVDIQGNISRSIKGNIYMYPKDDVQDHYNNGMVDKYNFRLYVNLYVYQSSSVGVEQLQRVVIIYKYVEIEMEHIQVEDQYLY